MKSRGHRLKNISFMIKLVWQYTPIYLITEVIRGIGNGINQSAIVIFTKIFYEYIDERASFSVVATSIGLMVLYICLFNIVDKWYGYIFAPIQREKLQEGIQKDLFSKAREIDLELYDEPEFYDDFIWSMEQCYNRVVGFTESIVKYLTYITATVATLGVIASVGIQVAVIAVVLVILDTLITRVDIKIDHERQLVLNPLQRKAEYLERIFSTPEYAKEVRTSRIAEVNDEKYIKNLESIRKESVRFNKKSLLINMINNSLAYIGEPLVYMVLLYEAVITKRISLAETVAGVTAFESLQWFLYEIKEVIVATEEHTIYIEKIRKFLSYKSQIKEGDQEAARLETLEVQNIHFGYQQDQSVLKGIDFTIRKGEKIAIVGYNGAGKTTFIKLLLNLYTPHSGKILYNGQTVENYTKESYRERIGVVFQDYKIFAASIAENVLGDIFMQEKSKEVLAALDQATFCSKLGQLDNGIYTELTREFSDEGIQLSGGEAQKIAIARVFAKPYDLLILDEPSSALDPMAESELTRSMLSAAEDKTVIFISHRLATTRGADRIYMFEDGRIIEVGTHDELIALDGKYAEMFNVQAEKYIEKESTNKIA